VEAIAASHKDRGVGSAKDSQPPALSDELAIMSESAIKSSIKVLEVT